MSSINNQNLPLTPANSRGSSDPAATPLEDKVATRVRVVRERVMNVEPNAEAAFEHQPGVVLHIRSEESEPVGTIAARAGIVPAVDISAPANINAPDAEGRTPLMRAVESESVEEMQALITAGADCNARDNEGQTALMLAASYGQTEVVRQLINAGADRNAADNSGLTALMLAAWNPTQAENGNVEVMDLLIRAGANCEARSVVMGCQTALMLTTWTGNLEGMRWLIEHGRANINTRDVEGRTALMIAVIKGSTASAMELIRLGARRDAEDKENRTALMFAAQNGQTEVVRQLINAGAKLKFQDRKGQTALMLAATGGHTETLQLLIDGLNRVSQNKLYDPRGILTGTDLMRSTSKIDVNLNIEDENGKTAFMLAAENGQVDVVRMLMTAGVKPTAESSRGTTAFMLATANGQVEVMRVLMDAGVNSKAQNACGETALIRAAENGQVEAMQLLLAAGVDLEAKLLNDKTAFTLAAENGHVGAMNVLIAAGIDPKNQSLAFACAAKSGQVEAMQLLLTAGVDSEAQSTAFIYAAKSGQVEAMQLLLTAGVDSEAQSAAFIDAARNGQLEAMRLLLAAGVDPKARNKRNQTALMLATENDKIDVVRHLIGVDKELLEMQDIHGNTALIYAAESRRVSVMQALIDAGANPDLQNEKGQTALMLLMKCEQLDLEVVSELIKKTAKFDLRDENGQTALMLLAKRRDRIAKRGSRREREEDSGDSRIAQALITAGASPDIQDNNGQTALMLLIQSTCAGQNTLPLLIQSSANPNIQDNKGQTALMYAARIMPGETLSHFINVGIDPDIQDNDGQTALMYASKTRGGGARWLITAGARLNIQDNNGQTALIHATQEQNVEGMRQLIDNRADLNVKDNDGQTALMYASKARGEGTRLLITAGARLNIQDNNGQTALMHAARTWSVEDMSQLIDIGADLTIQDNNGQTALIHAARVAHAEGIRLLINARADLNVRDTSGKTALMYAAENETTEGLNFNQLVNQLINARADLNIQDNSGQTALMHAVRNGRIEVIQRLVAVGVNLDATDNDGQTALRLAAQSGNPEVAQRLTEAIEARTRRLHQAISIPVNAAQIRNHDEIRNGVLRINISPLTAISLANEHLASFAHDLRSYHQADPHGLSRLKLKVSYIGERGIDAGGLSRRFIKEILENPILLARRQAGNNDMELFKELTDETNNGLCRLLCKTQTIYNQGEPIDQVNVPLSPEQVQLCQNIGTVLHALSLGFGKQFDAYNGREVYKYVIGQLFPPEFYAGLLWIGTYQAKLSERGEVWEIPWDMVRNDKRAIELCAHIANSDSSNLGYGLFDRNINFDDRQFLSHLSNDQLHQFCKLLFNGLDLEELSNLNESSRTAMSSAYETFMNQESTPEQMSDAANQFRNAVAVDQVLYEFTLQSLKSTLYGFYGSMIPPLLAVAQGSLHTSPAEFDALYNRLSVYCETPDSNQLRKVAIGLSTYIQGKPFTRENFINLIERSVANVDRRIRPQCGWLLGWFKKQPEEGGATDDQMKQFLNTVTGAPVITAHLETSKIEFAVASNPGIFIHTCFNKIDISPDLPEDIFIPTILSPSILEGTNAI